MLAEPTATTSPSQSTPTLLPKMPTLPTESGSSKENNKSAVKTLSLVVMCLSILSLVLGVTTIYYCGKYGLFKKGLCSSCEDEEYRSHTGFISLANDIDMDEDDEV